MRFLSRWNTTVRKFRDVSPGIANDLTTRRRPRYIGTRYVPLDRLARWMIWVSTLLVFAGALVLKGPVSMPYLLIGTPIALALGFMLARMVDHPDWDRLVALLYVIGMLFVFFCLPS